MTAAARRAALVAALVTLGGGCQDHSKAKSTAVAPPAQVTQVVTQPAREEPLSTIIESVGTARASESISVTSKSTNIVTAIAFREGAMVRAGQVLVQLDSNEAKAALAEAEATLINNESQFRRSQALYAQQALSVSQLDQIEAGLKASRARVDAAQARLADTVIRAGFDGRVGLRHVSVGSLVNPGTVITTLDDSSVIKLEFSIPENFMHLVKIGQRLTASSAGLPDTRFAGTIARLDSRVDAVTRSILVIAEIPNRDGRLLPGMFMNVTLQFDPTPTVLVPESAVVPEQGHAFVFVTVEGVANKREVRTGRRRRGEVEILEGLKSSERVVVEGSQMLRDGDKVHESPAAAAKPTQD